MLRPRIIPRLLVKNGGLVKTVRFDNPKYVGDPINAVSIFNEKEVDELIVLDIDATTQKREPNYALIKNLAAECSLKDIVALIHSFGIIGAAAESLFVFKGVYRAVLINYPSPSGKDALISRGHEAN